MHGNLISHGQCHTGSASTYILIYAAHSTVYNILLFILIEF